MLINNLFTFRQRLISCRALFSVCIASFTSVLQAQILQKVYENKSVFNLLAPYYKVSVMLYCTPKGAVYIAFSASEWDFYVLGFLHSLSKELAHLNYMEYFKYGDI